MSDHIELKAQARERAGKGAARELRRNSIWCQPSFMATTRIPCPSPFPTRNLSLQINSGGFMNTVLDIDVDGTNTGFCQRTYQREPVRDFFTHVDFLRIGKNTKVTVEIPVHYINEEACPGLKVGGVLNVVRHTLEVACRADAIPEAFRDRSYRSRNGRRCSRFGNQAARWC